MFKFLTSIFLTFTFASNLFAQVLTVDSERLVSVIDVVDFSIMEEVVKMEKLTPVVGDRKPVYIMINSPGGYVNAGLIFTNAMDRAVKRGYQLKCFTTVLAASMAFQMLAHCSEVYALKHAKLLFHPVSVSGDFRQKDLDYISGEIRLIESVMNKELMDYFKFNQDMFAYHYDYETLWEAFMLARETTRIKIIQDITGLPASYTYRKPRALFFGQTSSELIYIKPEILKLYNLTEE